MGIFSGCILASDYDGTLANSSGQISDDCVDFIGVMIGVLTVTILCAVTGKKQRRV